MKTNMIKSEVNGSMNIELEGIDDQVLLAPKLQIDSESIQLLDILQK